MLLLSACNSGDTAGGKARVVGYSSFAVFEGKAPSPALAGQALIEIAKGSIANGLGLSSVPVKRNHLPWLLHPAATFVTLTKDGELRGFRIRRSLSLRANPFLRDHVVGGQPVLPAAHAITWIANQMVELFMRSAFVDEVYADDQTLRRKLKDILRKHMQHDEDLDREVRRHLKHLQDGTDTFEIEYQKQLELVKRKHGLS